MASTGSVSPAGQTPAPEVISLQDISKRFVIRKDNSLKERLVTLGRAGRRHREEFWALRGLTAQLEAGQTVALIGHNGSGKSTLLKIIGGIIEPTRGTVRRRGRIAALLELGAGFHPDLTGRENVFLNASILGMSQSETEARFDDIVAFSGIGEFIDTQVKFYSSGMYVRLAFAVAVHTDPDILLVDEVLAVGDEAFQRKCLDTIKRFQTEGRTIILVTHSMGQVSELADRAILLHHGEVIQDGDPNAAIAAFRDLLESERRDQERDAPSNPVLENGRVLSASVQVAGRAADEPFQPGDDIVITTTLEHTSGIAEWVCAVQIDNVMGQPVWGTTTRRVGIELAPLEGTRTLALTVDDAMFAGGKYFVNVSLMDFAGRHLHDLVQATSFNVADQPDAAGSMYARPRFKVVD
ncbi:ABC transporter ATP-binding protein [Agromyces kandeliae]|uniref:ATP-binding cassette domain-containing protein n=1 Tax=Agromyces kandeliae TaxID=2666141 RepID=A0A6L5QYM6_9MICO|nr:ABC transporter ATP-binding protein [Agromyces kandeliae]MRX42906.1 ATP-binding cassette domain-containing protein [Agromyces kandeliae]